MATICLAIRTWNAACCWRTAVIGLGSSTSRARATTTMPEVTRLERRGRTEIAVRGTCWLNCLSASSRC